jgi:two-component system, NtrC family, response regulator
MAEILIIDDDKIMSYTLTRMVQHLGHKAFTAFTLQEGVNHAMGHPFDAILLDVRLPDGNGLEIIPKLKATASSPEIIIITAYGDSFGAELALNSGVWDYIEKPLRINEMKLPLMRVLEYRKQKATAQMPFSVDRCGIIGSSAAMTCCVDLMGQAAAGEANVLISGETGTGKEMFALAVHRNSRRCHEPFIVVDCAALPEHLVESILFGHVQGAFTGADKASEGLIKQADGGTLFLDEIGELPPMLQKIFLRVLQERYFRPVGSKTETASDFRLIAATNRDLEQMTREGSFRSDLLHRLRTLSISLPLLKKRREDIKELILHHVDKLCGEYGLEPKGFAPEFLSTLTKYRWPGNVRELINTLESAVNRAVNEPILYPIHLPPRIRAKVAIKAMRENSSATPATCRSIQTTGGQTQLPLLKEMLDETKKEYLHELVRITNGNIDEAGRIAGLSRASIYNYFKKYDIDPAGKPSS